jgi:hypothetical protein
VNVGGGVLAQFNDKVGMRGDIRYSLGRTRIRAMASTWICRASISGAARSA